MNGFKIHYLFFLSMIAFFCISCSKNVKVLEGEALFFVYKFVPKILDHNMEIWFSSQQFQKENIADSTNAMHQIFFDAMDLESKYIVLRFGTNISPTDTFIDRIEYEDKGTSITLKLHSITEAMGRMSDRGYPIFIVDKGIHQIIFKDKQKVLFITNFNH